MKHRFTGVIRPLLVGLAFAIAASTAHAMPPRGGGCSGGAELGACAEAGWPVSICCWMYGM